MKVQEKLEDIESKETLNNPIDFANAVQVLEKEHLEYKEKENKSKQIFSQAWQQQIAMNKLHTRINNSFKN
jgi:hypothetical protein